MLEAALQEVGIRYYQKLCKLEQNSKQTNKYCVNIGASDGVELDPLYHTYVNGYSGLAIEPVTTKFNKLQRNLPHLKHAQSLATPENIIEIFRRNGVPEDPDAVDIDIDGYDFHVADKILQEFSPKILSLELNPIVPPGILFTVDYYPEHFWKGPNSTIDPFYGCSIDMAASLCEKYDYSLLDLDWIEIFLVNNKHRHLFELPNDTMEAFKNGFWDRQDRSKVFYWIKDEDNPLLYSIEENFEKLREMFTGKDGKYFLALTPSKET